MRLECVGGPCDGDVIDVPYGMQSLVLYKGEHPPYDDDDDGRVVCQRSTFSAWYLDVYLDRDNSRVLQFVC